MGLKASVANFTMDLSGRIHRNLIASPLFLLNKKKQASQEPENPFHLESSYCGIF